MWISSLVVRACGAEPVPEEFPKWCPWLPESTTTYQAQSAKTPLSDWKHPPPSLTFNQRVLGSNPSGVTKKRSIS
jgi:hypothetical protein